MAAVLSVLLKSSLQLPRPTPRSGFGFPSGDSATAFGVAAAVGTAAARANLLSGWTPNKIWPAERIPFNSVEGLHASVQLDIAAPHDSRMRVRAYPYRPRGFLCQRADVTINGASLGRLFLEQDWQSYELKIPERLLRAGDNRIDFAFAYSDRANWHSVNREQKPLSVAFHKIQLIEE